MPTSLNDHPLALCFHILQGLGKTGEYVWRLGKQYGEDYGMEFRLAYLQDSIDYIREKAAEGNWRTLPVDFRTFVESSQLLNKRGVLWPEVIRCGSEMNNGKFTEVVLTGAIGVAKTTLALYSQAYQIYVLSCLADPHRLFDLDPSSEILIVFQSINKHLAQDVDYTRFRDMCLNGPYFQEAYPFDTSRESEMRFPRRVVVKPVAGHDTAAIGQNVIGGIIDEVNFMAVVENSKNTRDGSTYDQATQNYNTIARRRQSRFMQLGSLPGLLCLVSSRNYPGQFTDKKEEEARTNPQIYIYDKRIWELRPERFCGEWFPVFIGDETRKPRILEAGEEIAAEDRHLMIDIPIEYRSTFEADLLAALRDVAGVATQALHPFILNSEAVANCFGKVPSIASRTECDFVTSKIQILPNRFVNREEPRFAHIDLALSKDSAGISVGHIPGFVDIDRGDYKETLPLIQFDMILEVMPPKGGEILYEKIRRLLYTLRDQMGMNLKWISFDQYQSKDSMQILYQQGFITGYQSMDTTTFAYDVAKQAFYDDRVRAPEHKKAVKELITLEHDPQKNKIDHPPQGSKDVADSIAGVIVGLTSRRDLWVRHKVPFHKIPQQLMNTANSGKNSIEKRQEAKG